LRRAAWRFWPMEVTEEPKLLLDRAFKDQPIPF
jgi:hypothetical protein